jgi:hypothetical protein
VKRFPQWRRMTWAIVFWIGAMVTWGIHAASTSSTVVADCAADGAVKAGDMTQRDCVFQASIGIEFGVVTIAAVGFVGLLVLGALWFMSRPLWRQGYGARLHRLRLKAEPAVAGTDPDRWHSRFETTSSPR